MSREKKNAQQVKGNNTDKYVCVCPTKNKNKFTKT